MVLERWRTGRDCGCRNVDVRGLRCSEALSIEDRDFPNLGKIRTVVIPTLIIHGECDRIIPPGEGEALFRGSAAGDKRLVIIPEADHNDIMWLGREPYFQALREFVSASSCNGKGDT